MGERRRGAELEEALLEAAWDELVENGYASLTMDSVAARAHTSRPVLYRRWPDRHELVRAAIGRRIEANRPQLTDTGSLRSDLLAVLRHANSTKAALATTLNVHLAGFYQETGTSPADLRTALSADRRSIADVLLSRAAERGEVRLDRVTERMKKLPFDLVRQEFMMTLAEIPDEVLVEIVDTLYLPLLEVFADYRPADTSAD
jgi:AcrR family transcriptional regulator